MTFSPPPHQFPYGRSTQDQDCEPCHHVCYKSDVQPRYRHLDSADTNHQHPDKSADPAKPLKPLERREFGLSSSVSQGAFWNLGHQPAQLLYRLRFRGLSGHDTSLLPAHEHFHGVLALARLVGVFVGAR